MKVLDLRKYLKGNIVHIRVTEGHDIYTITFEDNMGSKVSIIFTDEMLLQLLDVTEDLWNGDWEWEWMEESIEVEEEGD
jgi:hypothetical protein